MSESAMLEYVCSFQQMKNEKKWVLKSGKCVEDKLYAFGKQCRFEQYVKMYVIAKKFPILIIYGFFCF
jgi:hypothetical protein